MPQLQRFVHGCDFELSDMDVVIVHDMIEMMSEILLTKDRKYSGI